MKKFVAAVGLAALGSSVGVTAQTVTSNATGLGSSTMIALHPAVTLTSGDKVVGPLAFSQPMHVVVTLKLRNEQQLDKYIAKPGFRPLTSGQFQMLYSPTPSQAQAVADYLTKAGFSNVKIAAGNALVEADGHADTAQAAFNTSFVQVKTHDGRDAFANSSAVKVPASLQGVVHTVLGMQNVHVPHVSMVRHNASTEHAAAVTASAVGGVEIGHQPSDFPFLYGAAGMPNVTSLAVGSIAEGPMTNVLKDLSAVDPGVMVTLKGNTIVANGTGTNSNDGEFDLDSQVLIAFTGVKHYYFYVGASSTDSDLQMAIAQAVSDNLLKAIDVSFGECETNAQSDGVAAANDTSFKQAVAQGQTFFVSSGDSGADECKNGGNTPAWPASSQYVTSVGGTQLLVAGSGAEASVWQNEIMWNQTGGSPSSFEPIPSWQVGILNLATQTYRSVPDIAFDGDPDTGAIVTVDGQTEQIGGTSLSAPLATGMWAHILQSVGTNVGFASPVLYKVAQSSAMNYYDAFHDIVDNSNDPSSNGAYGPIVGWDDVSGWGSVIVNQFAKALVSAEMTSTPGSPLVSFGTLPALQVTTPIPGSAHVPGDFNGDGVSDILWFNPDSSQVGYWTMASTTPVYDSGISRTGVSTYNVTSGYFVGAVGDFNNDGYADLVYTSANRDLWLWTNNQHGGWTSTRINSTSYPAQWQLVGAGDIDGDGYDDLLWLDPSECKFGYWTMKGATVTGYHTINIACGYYPISIGYYTPSNRLSIIWTSPENDLYIWDSTGSNPGNTGNGFNAYNLGPSMSTQYFGRIISVGGGVQGQNMGLRAFTGTVDYDLELAYGVLLSRSFDANNNQTGIQVTNSFGWPSFQYVNTAAGSAAYLIVGNGVNQTGVYDMDPTYNLLGTAGLSGGNAPQSPGLTQPSNVGNSWVYPTGWWVVGAPFNNTATPPWQ